MLDKLSERSLSSQRALVAQHGEAPAGSSDRSFSFLCWGKAANAESEKRTQKSPTGVGIHVFAMTPFGGITRFLDAVTQRSASLDLNSPSNRLSCFTW
jgi:hypothetical protein